MTLTDTQTAPSTTAAQEDPAANGNGSDTTSPPDRRERSFLLWLLFGPETELTLQKLTPQSRARLLYDYCVSSNKNVSETVHNLYIMGEHYAGGNDKPLQGEETVNNIPAFFKDLSAKKKSDHCYNLVTKALAVEAAPVTVESLRATERQAPADQWSSYAGQFVLRVTRYVIISLLLMIALYLLLYRYWNVFADGDGLSADGVALQWIGFGCIGALVHLLNTALTTTRLQTFQVSETRKIAPRLLLGGMFGYVVPWLISQGFSAENIQDATDSIQAAKSSLDGPTGSVLAFFAGYSVRFSIGLLDRLLAAILPETKTQT